MIVVDTNIIAYLLLTSEQTSFAEQALLRDPDWLAPVLWRSELRNILVHYIRLQRLNLSQTALIMEKAERLLRGHQYQVGSQSVLSLAVHSGCSAYDCEFVALAQQLDVPLVTTDKQLLRQFPNTAIALSVFVAGNQAS